MKLNGLTNNLKEADKTLSNRYLSHIVELLRQEVETLATKEAETEVTLTEHIETQNEHVDTVTVNAETVNADKVVTPNINDKILLLENAIQVLTSLKVNGHDVITDESFTGPFSYKGVVSELPEHANAGDCFIYNNSVYISDGTDYSSYEIPTGSITRTEYDADKESTLNAIAQLEANQSATQNELDDFEASVESELGTIGDDVQDLKDAMPNKLDKNPEDDNAYVRKDDDWVPLTDAQNAVAHTVVVQPATEEEPEVDSIIDNSVNGVSISSPRVAIDTDNFTLNGEVIPEVSKFGLSKTKEASDESYYYKLKFGRDPYLPYSSFQSGWVTHGDSWIGSCIASNTIRTFFTKNWQYTKWNLSTSTGADNNSINITAVNKDGKVNNIKPVWNDWIASNSVYLSSTCFFSFNPEYAPDGYEDVVYLFCPGSSSSVAGTVKEPYLLELKDGEFSRKISMRTLVDQGWTPAVTNVDCAAYVGQWGGKGLRNKNIKRICIVAFNVANNGGNIAIIIGGTAGDPLDVFDPTKAIYLPLPRTVYGGNVCLAATDSAWYIQESNYAYMLRISPNGQLQEIAETSAAYALPGGYIEYKDINNKPAVGYYLSRNGSSAHHSVMFIEEADGQAYTRETDLYFDSIGPTGDVGGANNFKFIENDYYVFFTLDFGKYTNTASGTTALFPAAAAKKAVWYWRKADIMSTGGMKRNDDLYGIAFEAHSFIDMYKTKDGAIWFPYLVQDTLQTASNRTGYIAYVSNVDYEDADVDFKYVNLGTNHAFFSAGNKGLVYYTHPLQGSPSWGNACARAQLFATNDDGILCIMSSDGMAYALCYGDGNFKVYECTNHDLTTGSGTSADPDKEPIMPDENEVSNNWARVSTLYGASHGWVLSIYPVGIPTFYTFAPVPYRSLTYIGCRYIDGEPTILQEPVLTKLQRCFSDHGSNLVKFEKYSYLQTYDDYERRKKVLGDIRMAVSYMVGSAGTDGYFKEERVNEVNKLNLTYDGQVISSVEE